VPYVPEELRAVAEGITQNRRQIASVRTLLLWFGFNGRNNQTNQQVQQALESLKLRTDPEFTSAGIDDNVTFIPQYDIREPTGAVGTDVHVNVGAIVMTSGDSSEGSAYRIGKLPSARKTPVSVSSETTTEEVVTLMLVRDFSQLVVLNPEKEVVGMVSWKSLGSRLALGKRCRVAGDFTEKHDEVGAETSVFEAIPMIVEHGCVLVRDSSGKVRGIVTASDLAVKFSQFGEPFLLLEEIENLVRGLIGPKFTREQLEAACDPHDSSRLVNGIADLRFDEYIRLLDQPDRWDRLSLDIDRRMFIRGLEHISRIRSEMMHFDAAGIKEDDLAELRTFAQFLRQLRLLVS
jgi:CBS domain-containing protein